MAGDIIGTNMTHICGGANFNRAERLPKTVEILTRGG
jgi:hypothetical protein